MTSSPDEPSKLGASAEIYHEELARLNNELAVLARENRRKNRELEEVAGKLEQTLHELNESHWLLRKVEEVLPMCLRCGSVDAGADWQPLVDYVRSNATFVSHSYCPSCAEDELRHAGERQTP